MPTCVALMILILVHDQERIIFSFLDVSSHLMLLTELRPRGYPSVLLAHGLSTLS